MANRKLLKAIKAKLKRDGISTIITKRVTNSCIHHSLSIKTGSNLLVSIDEEFFHQAYLMGKSVDDMKNEVINALNSQTATKTKHA